MDYRRTTAIVAAAGLLALGGAPSAGAATQIGETFTPAAGADCDPGFTYLQSGSFGGQYTVPSAGVITSWSFTTGPEEASPVKLKVARPEGGNVFTIVGESEPRATILNAPHTFPIRIAVEPGDVIGLRTSGGIECLRGASGYQFHSTFPADPAAGTTMAFTGPGSGVQFDIAAQLEPDCDGDGFGDETQDAPVPDCDPPDTGIAKGPKKKTRKRQARFQITSTEPGSTLECSLDGAGFAPCVSPRIVKVDRGRHSFQARATDPSGNTDPTPVIHDWKRRKG